MASPTSPNSSPPVPLDHFPGEVHSKKQSAGLAFAALSALLIAVLLLNVLTGEAEVARTVGVGITLKILGHHLFGLPLPPHSLTGDTIIWSIRMPRALGGALVGMLLAMAGVAFQSLLRNPLADPYMVGVSAGSAFGSVLIILTGSTAAFAGAAQPLAAFASGLATMTIVYSLSKRNGRLSTQSFLLLGLIIGSMLWSLTQLTLSMVVRSHDPGRAEAILSQQLGSLLLVGWRDVVLMLPFGLGGLAVLWSGWRELNLMTLGEESATHLGVDAEAFKRRVILAGSLVTAAAVSVAGIIAFVGLIVPHIARRLVGPDHRALLPTSMLLGGLIVVLSDWMSRVFLHGLEIGIITSLLGGPVFCYLLRRRLVTSQPS